MESFDWAFVIPTYEMKIARATIADKIVADILFIRSTVRTLYYDFIWKVDKSRTDIIHSA